MEQPLSRHLRLRVGYMQKVSGYKPTNHFNPEAFHNNVADPAYGLFFGQRGRRCTTDFDILLRRLAWALTSPTACAVGSLSP